MKLPTIILGSLAAIGLAGDGNVIIGNGNKQYGSNTAIKGDGNINIGSNTQL